MQKKHKKNTGFNCKNKQEAIAINPYLQNSLLLLISHLSYENSGVSGPELTLGHHGIRQHDGACRNDAVLSNVAALLDDGALAYQRAVAHDARCQESAVAHSHLSYHHEN
jgi:hypothetical protein